MTVDGRDTATYWEERARPHLGTPEEWQAVSATGLPSRVGRSIHRLEERGVRSLAGYLPSGPVLDVGCGYGRWLPITGRGRTVIGMDFSPSLIARASQQLGAPVMVADARRIPVRGASVQAAYTVKVLQCLPQHERAAAVRELFDAVPAGGGVVVLLEKIRGEDGSPPDRWRRWAEEAGGSMVCWRGNHHVPLDRLLNAFVRRGYGVTVRSGPADSPDPARRAQPVRDRKPWMFGTYMAVRGVLLNFSLLLEPVVERVCPPRWAEHGLFVFRKA
jgi:SAM-dependent methyltransferase